MLQAPMFNGLSLGPFSAFDDGFGPPEVGVCRRHVAEAFVVTLVVIVFDERLDLGFEVAGQEVILQQDAVLQGLVPALDLALRLRMEWRAANMAHGSRFDVFRQFSGDVARPVVAEQARLVQHMRRRTA